MFNLDAALRRLAGDFELVQMLIKVYLDDAPLLMAEIKGGINAAQWPQVHRAAHSLRGLAANIDAHEVIHAALAVEHMTAEGNPPDSTTLSVSAEQLQKAVSATALALQLLSQSQATPPA